jgi:hypothetical protein
MVNTLKPRLLGEIIRVMLASLAVGVVMLPVSAASAHHRDAFNEPLGLSVTGVCVEPEPEPYVEVGGAVVLTLENEHETAISLMRIVWRYYERLHPNGIRNPQSKWTLAQVERDSVYTSQSHILSSWFSNRLGWADDLDKRLVVTVQWHSFLGDVVSHRIVVSEWKYFRQPPDSRCYSYPAA